MKTPGKPSVRVRLDAAHTVRAVWRDGVSLDDALTRFSTPRSRSEDDSLYRLLCYGTLRRFHRLDRQLNWMLDRPLKKKDADVQALLLVGLYQLAHTRIPDHAAVAETVEAVRLAGKPGLAGLMNAVLRRYVRETDSLERRADEDPVARWSHPGWLIDRLTGDWPRHRDALLEANNAHPPMWLRVNARRASRDAYAERLIEECGLNTDTHPAAPDALKLERPVDVAWLPGFSAGCVSVQDAAAQAAVDLLEAGPGHRVLDACAAPGGKTCHILEREPDLGEVVAVDSSAARIRGLEENLDRLGLAATVTTADAGAPETWWDGEAFDRILLDVPCSATGVIRRHPDIKLLRRPEDIDALAARQSRLLDAVWPMLAAGGRLVYASCSVLAAENRDTVTGFLDRTPSAAVAVTEPAPEWRFLDSGPGKQLLTGETDTDGFYYACLTRTQG